MNKQRVPVAAVCACTLLALPAYAATITVPGDFVTIQDAIDAAVAGDEVVVSPGTYNENLLLGKAITVRSTDPDDPTVVVQTIIDGDTAADGGATTRVVNMTGDGVTLSGFVIRNGVARAPFDDSGGGILMTTGPNTVVRNCMITGNDAARGGGLYVAQWGRIENCTVLNNTADFGAGLYAIGDSGGEPVIANNWFIGNVAAQNAGAIDSRAESTIADCRIISNSAAANGGGAVLTVNPSTIVRCTFSCNSAGVHGGGIYNINAAGATIIDSTFSTNSAVAGGGLLSRADTTVDGSTFTGNIATADGGGIARLDGTLTLLGSSLCYNTSNDETGGFTDGGGNSVGLCGPIGLGGCAADLDGSGAVDFGDILQILSNWGACP